VKVASDPEVLLAVLKDPAYHFERIGLGSRAAVAMAVQRSRRNLLTSGLCRDAAHAGGAEDELRLEPDVASCGRHDASLREEAQTARLTPVPSSRVGFRSVLNIRCAASTFVAQRSSHRATRKSTRAANRS
jgi:hypothetical protein